MKCVTHIMIRLVLAHVTLKAHSHEIPVSTKLDKEANEEMMLFEAQGRIDQNHRRQMHNAPQLDIDENLVVLAAKYAQELAGRVKSPKDVSAFGKNIAVKCGGSDPFTAAEAAQLWHSTVCFYDFKNPGYNEKAKSFTQMVWKETSSFGMGRVFYKGGQTSELDCVLIVALYSPKGNIKNTESFKENVSLGDFQPTNCNLVGRNDNLVSLNQQKIADRIYSSLMSPPGRFQEDSLSQILDELIKEKQKQAKESGRSSFTVIL